MVVAFGECRQCRRGICVDVEGTRCCLCGGAICDKCCQKGNVYKPSVECECEEDECTCHTVTKNGCTDGCEEDHRICDACYEKDGVDDEELIAFLIERSAEYKTVKEARSACRERTRKKQKVSE
jgi:hypothetical protein